ncbi:hypothetical protein B0H13DRAFT_1916822 [Mycena leptocephala]|nr:hypothetical protein B0H13DRAFT_1916822 [Mycena leptocephala]
MSDSPAEPSLAPFKDEVLHSEECADDSNAILKLLMTISSTAPVLLNFLPGEKRCLCARALPARPQRARHSAARRLCSRLIPRLTAIAFHSSSSSGGGEVDLELPAACLHALLAAIKRALAGKLEEGHADVAGHLVPVLYGLSLYDGGGPTADARVVGVAGDIIELVVQSLAPTMYDRRQYAEATASERNLLVLFEAGVTLDVTQTSTPASVRRRSSSGPRPRGQRAPVFRIVPVGSVVNINKHVDGVRPRQTFYIPPFLEREHEKTGYWSDQTALPGRRRLPIDQGVDLGFSSS